MEAEKVPRLPTAGSTVINGKLTLSMDPLPADLSRVTAQFVFLEIDCIRVKRRGGRREEGAGTGKTEFSASVFKLSSI